MIGMNWIVSQQVTAAYYNRKGFFGILIMAGLLPEEYYMIGDEAFVCSDQLLTPWSGHGLDLWRDSFNFHLSSMRQCIERAFAHLTQKWGIFWRPLRCSFKRWSLVCTVCAKLHNYCIDMKNEYPDVGRMKMMMKIVFVCT